MQPTKNSNTHAHPSVLKRQLKKSLIKTEPSVKAMMALSASLLNYGKKPMATDSFCGKHCRGKPGCWGTASPNSLNEELSPPVCGALGVIGDIGSAYHDYR